MTTLHLGVFDVPYIDAEGKTTGDVAEFLEKKYHILEIFSEVHAQKIADHLADGMAGALESMLNGATEDLTKAMGGASSKIADDMKQFISSGEMEKLGYPGVPTKAALMGVNHRLKKKRGPRRVSFIDTGQYQANLTNWVEFD